MTVASPSTVGWRGKERKDRRITLSEGVRNRDCKDHCMAKRTIREVLKNTQDRIPIGSRSWSTHAVIVQSRGDPKILHKPQRQAALNITQHQEQHDVGAELECGQQRRPAELRICEAISLCKVVPSILYTVVNASAGVMPACASAARRNH